MLERDVEVYKKGCRIYINRREWLKPGKSDGFRIVYSGFPLNKAGLFHCLDRKSEGIESLFEERHALLEGGPNNNAIT